MGNFYERQLAKFAILKRRYALLLYSASIKYYKDIILDSLLKQKKAWENSLVLFSP